MKRLAVDRDATRVFPDGSRWIPDGPPTVVGYQPNPAEWESWGKPTRATLFVGLRVGRATEEFDKGDKIPERLVYGIVFDVRVAQVGREYGASFVRQKGHYIPSRAGDLSAESRWREESMQVVLYPTPAETWAHFRRNVQGVSEALVDDLGQDSVIADFVKNGRIVEGGKYTWVSRKKRQS